MEEIKQERIDKLVAVGFTVEQAQAIIDIAQQAALSGGMF